jgi:hypothetical protein
VRELDYASNEHENDLKYNRTRNNTQKCTGI